MLKFLICNLLFCVAVSLVVLLLISSSTYSFSRNNYTLNEISLFLVHIYSYSSEDQIKQITRVVNQKTQPGILNTLY